MNTLKLTLIIFLLLAILPLSHAAFESPGTIDISPITSSREAATPSQKVSEIIEALKITPDNKSLHQKLIDAVESAPQEERLPLRAYQLVSLLKDIDSLQENIKELEGRQVSVGRDLISQGVARQKLEEELFRLEQEEKDKMDWDGPVRKGAVTDMTFSELMKYFHSQKGFLIGQRSLLKKQNQRLTNLGGQEMKTVKRSSDDDSDKDGMKKVSDADKEIQRAVPMKNKMVVDVEDVGKRPKKTIMRLGDKKEESGEKVSAEGTTKRITKLKEQLSELEAILFEKDQKLAELTDEVIRLSLDANEKEARLEAKDESITAMEEDLDDLRSRIQLSQKVLEDKQEILRVLEDKKNEAIEKNETLTQQLTDKDEQIVEVSGMLQLYKEKLIDASMLVSEKSQEIERLTAQLSKLEQLDTLRTAIRTKDSQMQRLQQNLIAFKSDLEATQQIVTRKESKVADLSVKLKDMQREFELYKRDHRQYQEYVEKLKDRLVEEKDKREERNQNLRQHVLMRDNVIHELRQLLRKQEDELSRAVYLLGQGSEELMSEWNVSESRPSDLSDEKVSRLSRIISELTENLKEIRNNVSEIPGEEQLPDLP